MEKATALDPLSLEYNIDLADIHRMVSEYQPRQGDQYGDAGAVSQQQ